MDISKVIIHGEPLSQEDISFIEKHEPAIYWSDDRLKHWSFDVALPSGRWLENMEYNENLTLKQAVIY